MLCQTEGRQNTAYDSGPASSCDAMTENAGHVVDFTVTM